MKPVKHVVWALFIMAGFANAQGTLYFSNLGQPSVGSVAIGSDSWIGQAFNPSPGSSGYYGSYILNSVQLSMNSAVGNPSGFSVSIYADNGVSRRPDVFLGNLKGSTDPTAAGVYTYTTSGITVLTGHNYFIVATAATPLATGAFEWSRAGSTSYSGQWLFLTYYDSSPDGSNWAGPIGSRNQFAIYATPVPVPEPGTIGLIGAGAIAGAAFFRKRRRR